MYNFWKNNFKKIKINNKPENFIYKGINPTLDEFKKIDNYKFIKNNIISSLEKVEKYPDIFNYGFNANIKQPEENKFNNENYSLGQKIINDSRSKKLEKFTIDLKDSNINLKDFLFSLYSNQYVFSNKKENKTIYPEINLLINEENNESKDLDLIYEIGKQKNLAKEMLNFRSNNDEKYYLLEKAEEIAKNNKNVEIEVIKGEKLLKNNLNLIYSVGKGSNNTHPHLINLKYTADKKNNNYESMVGKGVVFDTGGYNLKPSGYMEDMYIDKGGAVAVLHAFEGLVNLKTKRNIICSIPVVENSVSSRSYKPSDIIKSHKGLTVEITNTDAEGRLILADAMSYIQNKYKINSLIELSTLTGSCVAALGDEFSGLFTNCKNLEENLIKNGFEFGDYLWSLPLTKKNLETTKGKTTDLVNAPKGSMGASTAAAFLNYFVNKDVNWAHIDIAGPTNIKKPNELNQTGSTGAGVGLLINYFK